jgi:CelD/BcsL family acetyltransferase involved in cellulose biosynthesis
LLHTRIIKDRDGFDRLAADWLALEAQSGPDVLFQSFGWVRAVWDFEIERSNADFSPVIIQVYRGARLVGILPMELLYTGLRSVLAPIGYAFSQIANVLVAEEETPKEIVSLLIEEAKRTIACDTVLFTKVRENSLLWRGMPSKHFITGETLGAPIAKLADYPDFASYFQTIRAKTRKNIRNARNRLEREAPVTHISVDSVEDQIDLIDRTLTGRAQRLKEQGLTSRAFGTSHFQEFCASLVGHPDLPIAAFSLQHGDHLLAEQWGFVHAGRYYAYVATRDFSQSDESPGKMHLAEITKACSERGLAACDLGIPVMPYKLTWATKVIDVHDVAIALTLRGKILVRFWDVLLRPRLKSMVLRTPASVRVKIMNLIGRKKRKDY